jgi:DNA-directed RNA polymerase specialized sigma24 family protein
MSSPQPVTWWLDQLKGGDPDAAQKLWEGYFQRLVGLARKKLQGARRRMADEEDVALSAFDSFCRGAAQGRFPRLNDREDLWQLLVVITARKAVDLIQHENRGKRGGGKVQGESALVCPGEWSGGPAADRLASPEPTPEFAAQVAEEWERLLARLGDADLRAVALLKLEGYTHEEIADQLGCALRTVERKLRRIRDCWEKELSP